VVLKIELGDLIFQATKNEHPRYNEPVWTVEARQTVMEGGEGSSKIRVWKGESKLSLYSALLDAVLKGEEAGWLR